MGTLPNIYFNMKIMAILTKAIFFFSIYEKSGMLFVYFVDTLDTLPNIYFNMKDSGNLTKAMFFSSIYEKSGVLFVYFVDTLVCKLGSGACLAPQKLLAFLTVKYVFSHFSWYFFFKNLNLHLYRHTKCFQYERFWLF